MAALHERGIISSYFDYLRLPFGVLEDFRALMEGEASKQNREARRANRR